MVGLKFHLVFLMNFSSLLYKCSKIFYNFFNDNYTIKIYEVVKMKKINNLKSNYKVEELDFESMQLFNGGINPWVIGLMAWFGNEVVQNWDDIKKGMSDAWEEFSFE